MVLPFVYTALAGRAPFRRSVGSLRAEGVKILLGHGGFQPGTRTAPELDRYEHIRRERTGYPAAPLSDAQPDRADEREPIAVLADVLSRDGAELSATETRRRNLANADHLTILHSIWTAGTRDACHNRYRELVAAALPPGHRGELSQRARWLYRSLHAAELAGLDPAHVIRTAMTSRDLSGSRDVAASSTPAYAAPPTPAPPAARPLEQPRPPDARLRGSLTSPKSRP